MLSHQLAAIKNYCKMVIKQLEKIDHRLFELEKAKQLAMIEANNKLLTDAKDPEEELKGEMIAIVVSIFCL